MSNPFKVGDIVTPTPAIARKWNTKLTAGKPYTVTSIKEEFVRFIGDRGGSGGWFYKDLTYATIMANPIGQHAQVCHPTPKGNTGLKGQPLTNTCAEIPIDEEDDYDTRKANRRVTSLGSFRVGQRLVYKDGTPTMTSLTVKRCTATCVWFEETYSAAFDPNEFTTEKVYE